MLWNLLEKWKQLPNKTTISYFNDTQYLYKRIDRIMSQSETVYTTMKCLKPEIAKKIDILDDNNLIELKKKILENINQ